MPNGGGSSPDGSAFPVIQRTKNRRHRGLGRRRRERAAEQHDVLERRSPGTPRHEDRGGEGDTRREAGRQRGRVDESCLEGSWRRGPRSPEEQGRAEDGEVDHRHLLEQRRHSQADPGADDRRAADVGPMSDEHRQHRHGEEVDGVLEIRSVAVEIGVGTHDRIRQGREDGRSGPGEAAPDPPDENDRRQHERDRQQPRRQLVGAAEGDGEGVEPVAGRRLRLREVAIEDVAGQDPPADVEIDRLVAVDRLRSRPRDRPEPQAGRLADARPEGVAAIPGREGQDRQQGRPCP